MIKPIKNQTIQKSVSYLNMCFPEYYNPEIYILFTGNSFDHAVAKQHQRMFCSLLPDLKAVSGKMKLLCNGFSLITASHKYCSNRCLLCSAAWPCKSCYRNADVSSGCLAGSLCHLFCTFGRNRTLFFRVDFLTPRHLCLALLL